VHVESGDKCSVSFWVFNEGCIGLLLRRCIFLGCWCVPPNHTLSLSRGLGVGCFPTETIPVPQGWLLRIGHSEVDSVHVSVHGLHVCIVEVYVPRRQGASHKVCRTARFDHRAPVDVVILNFRLGYPRGTIVFLQQPSYEQLSNDSNPRH